MTARLFLLFLSVFGLLSTTVYYLFELNSSPNPILYRQIQEESSSLDFSDQFVLSTELPLPESNEIDSAVGVKVEQDRIKAEQERLRKERQVKIDKLAGYLRKVKSPMADYAHIIVEEAESCHADYHIITAIAGNESGYGRVPYKLYNPFGYLNKVQYDGWEDSLSDLVCKVAKYTNKYLDIYTLGKLYGAHNPEQWEKNIRWHLSQIP